MYELAKVGGYLLSPLTVVLGLFLFAGFCFASGRRRLAHGLAAAGFIILWVASTPIVARSLIAPLERDYPVLSVDAAPNADAIVVLGGSVAGRHPPKRPSIALNSASTRVWYAAELYRAGKAQWIVVAAGGRPRSPNEQVEAKAIAEMLRALGVPAKAIRLDPLSRNTAENAANSKVILQQLGARNTLLVTSALHMPRALKTFAKVWANYENHLIPAPTDVEVVDGRISLDSWIPSPSALVDVTRGLKEYAGKAVLAMI